MTHSVSVWKSLEITVLLPQMNVIICAIVWQFWNFVDFAEFKPWRPAPEGRSVELNVGNDSMMANGYIVSNGSENPSQIKNDNVVVQSDMQPLKIIVSTDS